MENKNKKRLLIINSVCGTGSTGRICESIADEYSNSGWEVRVAYGRSSGRKLSEAEERYGYRIGTDLDVKLHGLLTRAYDLHGFGSMEATRQFLEWAEDYEPDLVWLHNLHGYYLNIGLLFQWIKKRQRRQETDDQPVMGLKWTLHDCWSFTGHCAYFTYAGCAKWRDGCRHCPQKKEYPASFGLDRSARNYNAKRQLFCGIKNMTVITPSHWLEGLVQESFLGGYQVEVRHNTVDTKVFQPTPSDFRKRYGLDDKTILLGVASPWNRRKGLEDFKKLAGRLGSSYRIVLVGLSKSQQKGLPRNIIGISKIEDANQLAGVYSAADFFCNLSYEENYPTVCLEARACGCRIITYDAGGNAEAAGEGAAVVPAGDVDGVAEAVRVRV